MIRITCPCCGVGINAEERLIGQTVRCPKCLSITKVLRPKRDNDDLAPVVEPNYETKVYEDEQPRAIDCPKCGKVIPAEQYLCKGCGWHTKLEAYFEDLTDEALAKGSEPKTKMERWFSEQIHELVSHTEFLIAAGLFTAFLGFVAIVVGRIFFGPLLGTILGLILSAAMAFGWLVLMRRFGALNDPKRDERLHKERMDQRAKVSRDPGRGRGVSEAIARPISESSSSSKSSAATSPRISLPAEEYDVDDIDLFSDSPVKPRKSSSQEATQSSPEHASSPSGSQKAAKNKDDDWLNDLLQRFTLPQSDATPILPATFDEVSQPRMESARPNSRRIMEDRIMARGTLFSILLVALTTHVATAQSEPRPMPISGSTTTSSDSSLQWRNPGAAVPSSTPSTVQPAAYASDPPTQPAENVSKSGSLLKVTSGLKELPNGAGQVWRDYDLTPYTSRVTTTAKPEQAIIDWILRETGTDVWFGDPLGMLSANKSTLRVYHTPEMQEVVTEVVTKFVDSQAEVKKLGVRLVTVKSPNWRRLAYRMMQPVSVKTPGIEAWLMSKENAAVLLNELRQRSDFREHHAADLLVHNGQSSTISMLQPRTFVRGVRATQTFPGYELQTDQIEEGFSMEVSPLLTPDDRMIDAVLKCSVDQVEKFVTVDVDVPTAGTQRQAVDIQIPQMVSWRLHERFRWPSDQVLLISCGVVARPQAGMASAAQLPTLPSLIPTGPPRADGLMFVEFKGDAKTGAGTPVPTAQPNAVDSRGRY